MLFQLRVLQSGAAPKQLKLEANSIGDARQMAEQQGLTVLQIKQQLANPFLTLIHRQQTTFPLMQFCQEFSVLFEAGLSIADTLQTLIDKETHTTSRNTLIALLGCVQEGKTLSQAMTLQINTFPSLFIATVAAAETTGDLPEALHRYHEYLAHIDVLKKRIVSASVYPAIVLAFGLLVLMFLIIYVIPKFSKIYDTQVSQVSFSTQLLLSIGQFSQQYGLWIALVLLASIIGIVAFVTQATVQDKLTNILWKLPFFGQKVRIYYLSRFYRTFAMLLKSGTPVMGGLLMVNRLLGVRLNANLVQATTLISQGKPFSQALFAANLTTPVALRLFNVGEKTGSLHTMMAQAASFHEEEMTRWVDQFTKVFEPTLMAVLGILIGGIVLMMYMPIFELASGIQ